MKDATGWALSVAAGDADARAVFTGACCVMAAVDAGATAGAVVVVVGGAVMVVVGGIAVSASSWASESSLFTA